MKINPKVNNVTLEQAIPVGGVAQTEVMEMKKNITRVHAKKKEIEDDELLAAEGAEQVVDSSEWSRVLGEVQLAQLDAAAIAGSASGAGAGAAGAAAAAAGAGTVGVGAATSFAALTSTVTTVTAVGAATTAPTLGAVAGVAAAAGGGGGGGGGGGAATPSLPVNTGPQPLNIPTFTLDDPPTIPRPTPNPSNPGVSGPDTGSPITGDGDDLFDTTTTVIPPYELQALTTQLENLTGRPGNSLFKSLVIDLNSTPTAGDYRVYYYTQKELTQSTEFTTIGYYKGFKDVTGTILSDMISGNNSANILDGSAGNDLIYGGGGADTLYGGRGTDWILFKGLTRAALTANDAVYATGLKVNMGSSTVDSVVAGTFVYGVTPVTGNLSGFENAVGSDGADLIVGSDSANTLVGASGNDDLRAGAGDDILYGGAGTNNKLTGGAGADIFYVGYDLDPVKLSQRLAESQWLTGVTGTDVILDWDDASGSTARDTLVVNNNGTAILAGLASQATAIDLSIDNIIDLREKVTNTGVIKLAAGAGDNQIWLSSGRDMVYVGYEYDATGNLVNKTNAYDRIWDWDSAANSPDTVRDYLEIRDGNRAAISSILSPTGQRSYTWAGNDVLDLRDTALIINNGVLIVDAGSGNTQDYDTIFGTAGHDYLSAGNSGAYSVRLSSQPGDILWGGNGNDRFYVGYQYNDAADGEGPSYVENFVEQTYGATALIMDWKSGTDALFVANNSTAIIGGLDTITFTATDWAGSNTVDLSSGVTNRTWEDGVDGKIVARLGAGNDTFIGSHGNDWVYVGSALSGGYDYVNLVSAANPMGGGASGDGADRVYIDNWNTRVVIDGFDSNDNLYIDRRMITDYLSTSGIQTFKHLNSSDVGAVADKRDYSSAAQAISRLPAIFEGARVGIESKLGPTVTPQTYEDGLERSLLGLKLSSSEYVYGGAYYSTLNSSSTTFIGLDHDTVGHGRWFSNGAFTNETHIQAEHRAEQALTGAATAAFLTGYGLLAIPFVGPILAAPFITVGAFYLDDKFNNTFAHLNPEFNSVDLTASYAASLSTSLNRNYTDASVFSQRFTEFFGAPSDGFKPSVEFTGSVGGNNSIDNGVGGIVTITETQGGSKDTYVYLVASPDRMVQDNEARLIAHIRNSELTGAQIYERIQIYDGQTEIYQISDTAAISPPPDVVLNDLAYPASNGPDFIPSNSDTAKSEQIYNLDADDFVSVNFTFSQALNINDVIMIQRVIKDAGASAASVSYAFKKTSSGFDAVTVNGNVPVVTDLQASGNNFIFTDRTRLEVLGQERLVTYSVDVTRGDFTKTSNAQDLIVGLKGVSVNAYGFVDGGVDKAGLVFDYPYLARVDIQQGSGAGALTIGTNNGDENTSRAGRTLDVSAQPSAAVSGQPTAGFFDMEVNPSAGSSYVMQEKLYLGSTANDSQAAITANSHIMFGFAGNDVLTGGIGADLIYGGANNDTLSGGAGNDTLSGGAGKDVLDGDVGSDIYLFDFLPSAQGLLNTISFSGSYASTSIPNITLGAVNAQQFDAVTTFSAYSSGGTDRDIIQLSKDLFGSVMVDDASNNIRLISTRDIVSSDVSGTGVVLRVDPINSKIAEVDFSGVSTGNITVGGLTLNLSAVVPGATPTQEVAKAFIGLGPNATTGNDIAGTSVDTWVSGSSLAANFRTSGDSDSNIVSSEFASFNSLTTSLTGLSGILPTDPGQLYELKVQTAIADILASQSGLAAGARTSLFYDTHTGNLFYDANGDVTSTSTEYMSYVYIATFDTKPTLSYMDFTVI